MIVKLGFQYNFALHHDGKDAKVPIPNYNFAICFDGRYKLLFILKSLQTVRELILKELNSGINSDFLELRLELNLFLKIWNWNYLIPLKNGINSNSGNSQKIHFHRELEYS